MNGCEMIKCPDYKNGATEAEVQEYLLYIELAAKLYGERGETQ